MVVGMTSHHEIHVRNSSLHPVGSLTGGIYKLVFREALNAPGGWVFTAPSDHPSIPALLASGSGIVVTAQDGGQFAGYTAPAATAAKHVRTITDQTDTITVTGVSDLTVLWWRRIVPPAGQVRDMATGPLCSAVPQMVSRHLGVAASASRRLPGWQAALTATGPDVSVAGRYSSLGDECASHMGDTHFMRTMWLPGTVVFSVEELTARAIPISPAAGSATKLVERANGTVASAVYGLGSGQGTDRLIVEAAAVGIDPWQRIEATHDDTNEGRSPALSAAALAAIKLGGASFDAELVPGLNLRVGDTVRLYDSAGRLETVPVAETVTTITPAETVRTVTLGAPKALGLDRVIAGLRTTVNVR